MVTGHGAAVSFQLDTLMKIVPAKKINPQRDELMIKDFAQGEIWKTGTDRYAITSPYEKKPIHAFQSAAFTRLLERIRQDVLYIAVTENICRMCPCETEMMEINLLLKEGSIYKVSWKGVIYLATQVEI